MTTYSAQTTSYNYKMAYVPLVIVASPPNKVVTTSNARPLAGQQWPRPIEAFATTTYVDNTPKTYRLYLSSAYGGF